MCNPRKINNFTIIKESREERNKMISDLDQHHYLVMKALGQINNLSNEIHQNLLVKVKKHVKEFKDYDVIEIGKYLLSLGADNFCNGGFWIWDIPRAIEYYSPLFIKSLGFKDENDFPYVPDSWKKQITPESLELSLENYTNHIESLGVYPYYQIVDYHKKGKGMIKTICSGTALFKGENPIIMLGTHEYKMEKKTKNPQLR